MHDVKSSKVNVYDNNTRRDTPTRIHGPYRPGLAIVKIRLRFSYDKASTRIMRTPNDRAQLLNLEDIWGNAPGGWFPLADL